MIGDPALETEHAESVRTLKTGTRETACPLALVVFFSGVM